MVLARLALALAPLALVSCAVLLGLDDHEPYPDEGGAPDASTEGPDAACGDTQSDPSNCGACGVRCGAGYACTGGVCGNHVDAVAAGAHACALLHAGEVWCWGPNDSGQLGVRPAPCTVCPAPARVPGITDAVELAIGISTSCVRTKAGAVLCWGALLPGQASPDGGVPGTPQKIALPRAAKQVTTGDSHACALADDGTIYCWGDDTYGELGTGAPGAARGTPVKVVISTDVVEVAAGRGRQATCAAKTDGTVWCWGMNFRGLLGHAGGGDTQCALPTGGTIACNATPSPIASFTGFSQPTMSQIACANSGKQGAYCWGFNGFGQLGLGAVDAVDHATPAPITVATPVRVAPGVNHACALDGSGQVSCWGYNFWGTQGDGTIDGTACEGGAAYCQPKASHVKGLPKIVGLASGLELTVALGDDGSVWAWGQNTDGRTGHVPGQADGGASDQSCFVPNIGGGPCSPTPARVFGLP